MLFITRNFGYLIIYSNANHYSFAHYSCHCCMQNRSFSNTFGSATFKRNDDFFLHKTYVDCSRMHRESGTLRRYSKDVA